jgi:small subunit ribosomal protein S24e
MKIEVISEKENPLMKRKEYWVMVGHEGKETPSRHGLLPEVAKKLGAKEDVTVLCKVFSERGSAKSRAKIFVYADKKDVPPEKVARQERKAKKFLEKKAAAESAAKEKPEPAAEEKKEEAQPEDEVHAGEKEEGEGAAEGGGEKVEEESSEEKPEEDASEEKPAEEGKEAGDEAEEEGKKPEEAESEEKKGD